MMKCIVGAVATVLPAFPRTWSLPEHILFSQAWKAQFCFRHYLCSLIGKFSLNNLHSQMRWLPLHTMQRGIGGVADVEASLWLPLVCVLAAKVLEATLALTTELLLTSVLGFYVVFPIVEVKECWFNPMFLHCEEWPRHFQIGRKLLYSSVRKWDARNVWVIWKWIKDPNKTWNCCRIVYDVITIVHL